MLQQCRPKRGAGRLAGAQPLFLTVGIAPVGEVAWAGREARGRPSALQGQQHQVQLHMVVMQGQQGLSCPAP